MDISDVFALADAPIFAASRDGDDKIIAWSRKLASITGIEQTCAVGETVCDVFGPDAKPMLACSSGAITLPGLGEVSISATPKFMVGTLQDTEREAFIAMAAHDLQTPLRNIAFLAQEAAQAPGKSMELLASIENVGAKALGFTREIVGAVRASTAAWSLPSKVILSELAEDVFETLDPSERHRLISSNETLIVEKPVAQMVLKNLLDNALRHGEDRPKSVFVSVEAKEGMLEIGVEDDGGGFQTPAKTYLAGGEFRLESGYGLFGARRLVHARGGSLSVTQSRNGKGSVVMFTLPGEILETRSVAVAS